MEFTLSYLTIEDMIAGSACIFAALAALVIFFKILLKPKPKNLAKELYERNLGLANEQAEMM